MDATARVALLFLGFWIASPTLAVPITGSFSGWAEGWRNEWNGQRHTFENQPISGTFSFETSFTGGEVYQGDSQHDFIHWPVTVSFTVLNDTFTYDNQEEYVRALTLTQTAERQTAQLWFFAAYSNAYLTFNAPGGGLFQDFTPQTFSPHAIDLATSSAYFSGHTRSDFTSMRFERLTVDGLPPLQVPEPMTLSLLVSGLLLMTWAHAGLRDRTTLKM